MLLTPSPENTCSHYTVRSKRVQQYQLSISTAHAPMGSSWTTAAALPPGGTTLGCIHTPVSPPRDEAKAGTPRFYPNHPPMHPTVCSNNADLPLLQTLVLSLWKDNCGRSLRSQLIGHPLAAASSDPGQIISPTCVSSKHPFL